MDEYFCPNCGAILNDQDGFEPSCGTWTCTECGQFLMDGDIHNGDLFKGVAWFCDQCGELLNRQSGFSDDCGTWICTKCGHQNGITEDDILNAGPECPHCGAKLKEQFCFSEAVDDWECCECGAHLHREYSFDPYEVVEDDGPECPNCGAELEEQSCYGFADYLDDWECVECGAHLQRDYISNSYKMVEADEEPADDNESREAGIPVQSGEESRARFTEGPGFQTTKRVAITYPTKRKIAIPFSAKSLRKMNYMDAEDILRNLGFFVIYKCPIYDLVTGWLKKDGAVKKVTVDGVYPFKRKSTFSYDSIITIEYHTFKSKKK